MAGVDERPFPPGDYGVVVVGSGPGGLQTSYCLSRAGVDDHAVISADAGPGGMFRRFPIFERLITVTKPEAAVARGSREYEWYDQNSLVGDEPDHQALVPAEMDRTFDVPSRPEMEAALVAFADRARVRVRYGCRWEATRRDDDGLVLVTSDGEYRCRAAVFALGVTTPWKAPIDGVDAAPHYVETREPAYYRGKRVFVVGKRNSGFEVANGLLPWASEIVLASPRPVRTDNLARSALRVRYLQPYDEHVRGGTGALVVDASIDAIERHERGYRIRTSGTTWRRPLEFEADEVIVATGFRTPLLDLPALGVATTGDGRIPALTAFWESVSVQGAYFAGNASQGSPGLRKQGLASQSTSVNGFRYNARVLARHIAERHFGVKAERPLVRPRDVVDYLLGELTRAPELRIQRGYLARALSVADDGIRDEGILPLEAFVDGGGDAVAVAVEMDQQGTIYPAVYVRRGTTLAEHALPPHPTHAYDGDEHRRELEVRLAPLFG